MELFRYDDDEGYAPTPPRILRSLFSGDRPRHIGGMSKTPKPKIALRRVKPVTRPLSPKPTGKSKAAKPEVTPLGEHLAALLNPALNVPRPGLKEGQARFDDGTAQPVSRIDKKLADMFGLDSQGDIDTAPRQTVDPTSHPRGMTGASATAESLKALIEAGDPNIRQGLPWTPHRPHRPDKSEGGITFELVSEYEPKGDQPTAIEALVAGVGEHERDQVLLGVTGSGKTFTMAQVIGAHQSPRADPGAEQDVGRAALRRVQELLPEQRRRIFRFSYYDYYQPEAYVPRSDTYIEKESSINEQIDRMRHSATRALLERDDVIIVASVSCIYGIGSVETYTAMTFTVKVRRDDRRSASSSPTSWPCSTSAPPVIFRAACFACAATRSNCFPAHLRRSRLAHRLLRRRDRDASSSSIRSPARRCRIFRIRQRCTRIRIT